MKIAFVSIENSLSNIGFRRLAALVRLTRPDLEVGYVVPFRATGPWQRLKAQTYQQKTDEDIDAIASHLAKSDLVCFSSMSIHAEYTKSLIRAIRPKNPAALVVWGGIHPIVDPEDAISEADAVCRGEGEKAFPEFLSRLAQGQDYTGVGNFYFKRNGRIIRNGLLPLQTSAEMESLPYPLYADRELLFRPGRGFTPLTLLDYVRHEGLAYDILWAIGCPNRCIYCGNSRFLKNDSGYARLRYRSVDYVVGEVNHVRARVPHLSAVTFQDDCFMAIPFPVLEEFADKWPKRVGLPFAVHGLMSRYVEPEKMRRLIAAGMFRVRMGIQSGSPQTLKSFRRPDSVESIMKAVGVIHDFKKYMMTPSYDVIVDNPREKKEDIAVTIRLLHSLPRPFILNIFPLMRIPSTELAEIADRENLALPLINQGQLSSSLANALVLGSVLVRLPRRVLARSLARLAEPASDARVSPFVLRFLLTSVAIKRAAAHLRFGNLSVLPSRLSLLLWRLGIVRLANRRMLGKCASVTKDFPSPGVFQKS